MATANFENRTLYHGGNLPSVGGLNTCTVNLIATDSQFNKSNGWMTTQQRRESHHAQGTQRREASRRHERLPRPVAKIATEEIDEELPSARRNGGLKGGLARAEALTPEQRR